MSLIVSTGDTKTLNHFTPLRYPGGKAKLARFVKKLLEKNDLLDGHYAEPYAGGAGIAVELLLQEYVSHIHINDINRPVHAFWKSVLHNTDALLQLIKDTKPSVRAWDKQKKIYGNQSEHDDLALGFATFFLNRTNRSGILNGGMIGGRDQSGEWKIDARYNAKALADRIVAIAKLKRSITLTKLDAEIFLKRNVSKLPPNTLIYLDPPYYAKGKALYHDFYEHEDHERLASLMRSIIKSHSFMISYDNCRAIRQFYRGLPGFTYKIGYNAREVRLGTEVMFFSNNLIIPAIEAPMSACRTLRRSVAN
ncbi:DNA adenine methylase [Bradyrhizobium sp.]|uniref:DNA adenine methylase n=1 Tax=Bradyrhizobium sp. TaxID=376 RepID=UPI002732E146|nr:DNA adenine methylase [Bradyrhizobium sp.]MDP3077960.1 DNA adenine methylase [Bradyrhizobium sp.]